MSCRSGAAGEPPGWATEAVRIAEYDPRWPELAAAYACEVEELFAGRLSGEVVHVGSTAVPGLSAKPIIDLQAVSPDPASALEEVGDSVEAAGWRFVPRELDRRPWRWFFVRVDADERVRRAHLHLMVPGEERWQHQVLFRDRLRASARLREEYAQVKARAAADHRGDREAYGHAKTRFILEIVRSCG